MDSFRQQLELQGLSELTIKRHISNLIDYGKVGNSQRIIFNTIEGMKNTLSTRLSMASTLSKYLQFRNQPNDELVAYIREINKQIQSHSEQKQEDMSKDVTLPSVNEIYQYMESLYDKKDYLNYCLLFLMVNYQTRNKDLVLSVVSSKWQTNDTDNYIIVGKNQVQFVRNDYKTAWKYGKKVNIIRNKRFYFAITQLTHLLKPGDNFDRVIKKATAGIGRINEGTIAKIVLRENNTISGLKRVSKNRGTDINTLINSYNIT
jgi:hypothetical protein